MERFNGSFSLNNNYVEIENGVDMDRMHQDDGDLHSYLVLQHMNTPQMMEAHSTVDPNIGDTNDPYYMNGHSFNGGEDGGVYAEEEEMDVKPDISLNIKKEIISEHEELQDICIDNDFKEDEEGRVHLTSEYIKCVQEAKKSNRCYICNDSFYKLDQTIEHLQVEHFTEFYNFRYNCLNCRVAYRSTRKFNVHKMDIHNETELFKCLDCNNKILSKFRVYKHLLKNRQCRKTSIKLIQSQNLNRTNIENVCLDCRRVFKNVAALSNHIKTCDGQGPAPEEQPEEIRRKSVRNSTPIHQPSPPRPETPTCQYCNEKQITNLEKHEDICRRKICPKCSKVFTTTRNTIRHLRNIHNVPKSRIHTLWSKKVKKPKVVQHEVPVDVQENGDSGNASYNNLENFEEEEDEDVVLSIDCSTHEEIPLKRNRIK